jgi:hypothetical protein
MKKLIAIGLLSLGVMAGCSKYTVRSVTSETADFTRYRTFAWLPAGDSTNSFYRNDIAQERLVDEASKQLQARGLTLNNRRPDLLVKFTARVNNKKQTYREPVYYQPAPEFYGVYYRGNRYYYRYRRSFPIYVGDRERTVAYKEGTVIIDVIDRKQSKVIWRGWSEGQVSNAQEATNEVRDVVGKIFEKYPVKSTTN